MGNVKFLRIPAVQTGMKFNYIYFSLLAKVVKSTKFSPHFTTCHHYRTNIFDKQVLAHRIITEKYTL